VPWPWMGREPRARSRHRHAARALPTVVLTGRDPSPQIGSLSTACGGKCREPPGARRGAGPRRRDAWSALFPERTQGRRCSRGVTLREPTAVTPRPADDVGAGLGASQRSPRDNLAPDPGFLVLSWSAAAYGPSRRAATLRTPCGGLFALSRFSWPSRGSRRSRELRRAARHSRGLRQGWRRSRCPRYRGSPPSSGSARVPGLPRRQPRRSHSRDRRSVRAGQWTNAR
jgi:hypothetical protein